MQVNLFLDKTLNDIKITISAPDMTEQVSNILDTIQKLDKQEVYVRKDDKVYSINLDDVISFYTDDKNVYLKTKDSNYKIKYRLYELEENLLSKNFLRISNAVIVNEIHIKCFDTAQAGNIIVKLDDGSYEYISKRRIPNILKKLKEKEI